MSGDSIKGHEIFADDFLKRIQDTTHALYDLNDVIVSQVTKNISNLNKIKFDSSTSIKESANEMNLLAENTKKAAQAQKALADAEAAEQKVKQAKLKTEQELDRLAQSQQKTQQEQIKTSLAQSRLDKDALRNKEKVLSLYQQESKRLTELRNKFKDLALSEKDGTDEAKKMLAEITKLDTKLKKADAKTGQFQRNVGNYPKPQSGIAGAAGGAITSAVGPLALAAGVGSVFSDAIEANSKFEASLKNLSAITGATGKDLEFYKEQARELGLTTKGGAVGVVEAFKLIGSAKPELLENKEALNEVTQQAILLSKAAGLEVPDAATRLTDALNQFGAPAKDAAKFVDILAAGAKAGAAEVPDVTDALLKFGVAAKSSNISIQESVGAVELLAEKGLKGAEAGTSLRNVFAKLSAAKILPPEAKNELTKAGVDIKKLSDNSLPLSARLKELSKIQGNSAAITRVFGLENKTAGEVLISNIPRLDELTKSVNENGVAQEQAATNTDTFEQSLLEAKNGYNDLLLEITDGDFSVVTKFFVDNATQQFAELALTFKSVIVLFKEGFAGLKKLADEEGEKSAEKILRADFSKFTEAQRLAKIEELRILRAADLQRLKDRDFADEEELLNIKKGIEIRTKLLAILTHTEVDLTTKKVAAVAQVITEGDAEADKKAESARKKKEKQNQDNFDAAVKEAERLGDEEAKQHLIDVANKKKEEEDDRKFKQIQIDADKEVDELAKKLSDEDDARKKEKHEKDLAEVKQYLGKTLDLIDNELQRESQLKQDAFDKDLERRNQSIETQRNLAEKGLNNTLAFEEEQKAKTELAKEQEKKKAIRQQKAINFLKAYGSYLDNGKNPGEALTRAATDQVLAEVIAAAFFDGSEKIADDLGKPQLKGRDGYIVRVDGGERVMTGEQNKLVGNLSNDELANLANAYNNGQYLPNHAMNMEIGGMAKNMADSALLNQLVQTNKKLESLEKTISNKRESHIHLNNLGEVVTTSIERGIKTITTIKNRSMRLG